MPEETQRQSDSPGDQWPGTQRGEGSQITADDEGRHGASPEGEGARYTGEDQGSDGEGREVAGQKEKGARKIAWSMRFLP